MSNIYNNIYYEKIINHIDLLHKFYNAFAKYKLNNIYIIYIYIYHILKNVL